jgi:hypothetical protein
MIISSIPILEHLIHANHEFRKRLQEMEVQLRVWKVDTEPVLNKIRVCNDMDIDLRAELEKERNKV